ncbi:hypothetical protein BPTFM16_01927 [Altererythrobacter insulae]|nr:hypothetical protein BPTFM16_01927 [Altererythrobacter insulae]
MARAEADPEIEDRFAIFHRTDGSAVACRLEQIVFVGKGENGATLNFSGGAQVNVHESFDEVLSKFGEGLMKKSL